MTSHQTTHPTDPPSDGPGPAAGDAPAAPPTRPSGRRGKGYFLPGGIALIALLAIGVVFVGAGDLQHPVPTELSGADIASQIALSIQAEQNARSLPAVTCPAQEPVRAGLPFRCSLAGPSARPVYVTEVDGRGRIRWSFGGS